MLIREINTLKQGNGWKVPKDYQLLNWKDVVQIG